MKLATYNDFTTTKFSSSTAIRSASISSLAYESLPKLTMSSSSCFTTKSLGYSSGPSELFDTCVRVTGGRLFTGKAEGCSFTGMWQAAVTSILGRRKAVRHVTENCLVTWKGGRLLYHIRKEVTCCEEKVPETLKCPGIEYLFDLRTTTFFEQFFLVLLYHGHRKPLTHSCRHQFPACVRGYLSEIAYITEISKLRIW